jgi:hypothetical protein
MKRTALLLSLALVLLVLLIYEELAREPVEQNAQPAAGEPADLQSGEKPDWGKGANKIASADSEKVLFRIELPGGAWPEPVWFRRSQPGFAADGHRQR